MRRFKARLHRLVGIFRRGAREAEMNAELQSHLDLLAERNVAAGMSPEEARYAALRAFGGVAQAAEGSRDAWRSVWLEQLGQDVKYAMRSLVKAPTFTITAVLTLALGIGVNAGLFSLYNTVALRPLHVKDPDSLIRIGGIKRGGGGAGGFGYAEYLAYREDSRTLADLVAFTGVSWSFQPEASAPAAVDPSRLEHVGVLLVTENYLGMLGGRLQLGRDFLPAEVRQTAAVAVISDTFWKSNLHGDPNVIGTTVRLGPQLFTVIGVTTPEFTGHEPLPPAAWAPLTWRSNDAADYGPKGPRNLAVIGRVKPGITDAQAKADLDAIAAQWAVEFPGENAKVAVSILRGLHFVNLPRTAQTLARLSPLLLGFAMVLVIACTNVANLLIARGISRQPEMGVRLTLGASRGRIIRQLFTENLLLCVVGGAVGLALGTWLLQILEQVVLAPHLSPAWMLFLKPTPDIRVLIFTAALTVGAALVAGLVPAVHTARASLYAAVRNDGTAFGRGLTPSRLRQALVVVQVAVCLTLLSCAGMLAHNLFSPQEVDRGFDSKAVLKTNLVPNPAIADRNVARRQALEMLRGLPGVAEAGFMNPPPFQVPNGVAVRIRPVDTGVRGSEEQVSTTFITRGFLGTFGVPLVRGRTFSELEQQASARVVIVSEALAKQLWPGQVAVGKTLAVSEVPWGWVERSSPPPTEAFRDCEVIGVARHVVLQYGDENPRQLYLPFPLDTPMYGQVFARLQSKSAVAQAEIVRLAAAGSVTVQFGKPMAAVFESFDLLFYGLAVLSGVLGALALAMATVGLYGVMAFAVNQRVREIGIRMALGATAERVVSLFVRQGLRLVLIGLGLGLIGGGLFALLLDKLLFGLIHTFDPAAFATVTVLFAVIATFACWLPARRATKVDPVVALRAE